MPTDFKRRRHGTPNQLGKPFPLFNGEIPEATKQLKRATAKAWNADNPEKYEAHRLRWLLKKKQERVDKHGKQPKGKAKRPQ